MTATCIHLVYKIHECVLLVLCKCMDPSGVSARFNVVKIVSIQ